MTSETKAEVKIDDMPTAYLDKRGYRVVNVKTRDEAWDCKMEIFAENSDVYAYAILIPYCERTATVVYFVSGRNGDEFGQFPNEARARTRFCEITKCKL